MKNRAAEKLPPFYFRRIGDTTLLTNDWGHHTFLADQDFQLYLKGGLGPGHSCYEGLASKGFIRERLDFQGLCRDFKKKNAFLWHAGPSLHMIVTTLRCNQKCLYCHASVVDPSQTQMDMTPEVMRQTIDFIFSTPGPAVCIEFQGGESLINWPVVRFAVEYSHKKAAWEKRRLLLTMVSNFTLMNEEKMDYLLRRHVSICTSLDGPAFIHDQNRIFLGGGATHDRVKTWIQKIQKRCREAGEKTYYLPSALMTATRLSLSHGKEIVDAYVELGLGQIFLRSLAPIGYAKGVWDRIGYTAEEFVHFYETTLDYIVELNLRGVPFVERLTLVLLTKILKREDPGYINLRSPAGAGLSAVAYNYDGAIYAGDEARMLAQEGDPTFHLGHVATSNWEDVAVHPVTQACVHSSTLDSQPRCFQCAYKPFCGVEPVFNYEMQGSFSGNIPSSDWCPQFMGIFDVLFRKIQNEKYRRVFNQWLEQDRCMWAESGPEGRD